MSDTTNITRSNAMANITNSDVARLVEVQQEQSRLFTSQQKDIGGLVEAVKSLQKSVEGLGERVNAPNNTNWIGIGSLIISVVIGIAVYAEARLSPLGHRIVPLENWQRERSATLVEDYTLFGQNIQRSIASAENIVDLEAQGHTFTDRIATLEGAFRMLEKQVDSVDQAGSRKWVTSDSNIQ